MNQFLSRLDAIYCVGDPQFADNQNDRFGLILYCIVETELITGDMMLFVLRAFKSGNDVENMTRE